MRKIESQMLNAIKIKKNWQSGNTRVENFPGEVHVRIFGNLIAKISDEAIYLCNCGYSTKTTKSRMNAILSLATNNTSIYQKKRVWYTYGSSVNSDDSQEFLSGENIWNEISLKA